MENKTFRALSVSEEPDGIIKRNIITKKISDLPKGNLIVKVAYSSLNYKDALSANGNRGVTKKYPHTPGIDAIGVVKKCSNSSFQVGDKVIVTGFDLGMNTDGGFSEYIRIPSQWAIKLPNGLTMLEAAILGTAGLTAGLSVYNLHQDIPSKAGDIIVSGATGSVGSISIALLSKLGYSVTAITDKENLYEMLRLLGANKFMSRNVLSQHTEKALLTSAWAGGIDTTGGSILENIIKSTSLFGIVTTCGNIASDKLNLSVYPFILRGVRLIGITSQNTSIEKKEFIWKKFANEWKLDILKNITKQIKLDDINEYIERSIAGENIGRVVISF